MRITAGQGATPLVEAGNVEDSSQAATKTSRAGSKALADLTNTPIAQGLDANKAQVGSQNKSLLDRCSQIWRAFVLLIFGKPAEETPPSNFQIPPFTDAKAKSIESKPQRLRTQKEEEFLQLHNYLSGMRDNLCWAGDVLRDQKSTAYHKTQAMERVGTTAETFKDIFDPDSRMNFLEDRLESSEKAQKEQLDQIFEVLVGKTDATGKPYIGRETLLRYLQYAEGNWSEPGRELCKTAFIAAISSGEVPEDLKEKVEAWRKEFDVQM